MSPESHDSRPGPCDARLSSDEVRATLMGPFTYGVSTPVCGWGTLASAQEATDSALRHRTAPSATSARDATAAIGIPTEVVRPRCLHTLRTV